MERIKGYVPEIGTEVEVNCWNPRGDISYQRATVVGQVTDAILGCALVLQLGDERQVERLFPSPTIRLLAG
jgi:hypothetical protein